MIPLKSSLWSNGCDTSLSRADDALFAMFEMMGSMAVANEEPASRGSVGVVLRQQEQAGRRHSAAATSLRYRLRVLAQLTYKKDRRAWTNARTTRAWLVPILRGSTTAQADFETLKLLVRQPRKEWCLGASCVCSFAACIPRTESTESFVKEDGELTPCARCKTDGSTPGPLQNCVMFSMLPCR